MKPSRLIGIVFIAAGVAIVAALFLLRQSGKADLYVYNWADYIALETIENFERETGLKVSYDVYDSNEVLEAKMRAGKSGYDVVFPSDIWLKRGYAAGAYRKLDHALLPNLKNQNPDIRRWAAEVLGHDDLGIVYMWGTVGIGYNTGMVTERLGDDFPADSWALMLEPQYTQKLQDCGLLVIDAQVDVLSSVMQYLGRGGRSTDAASIEAAAAHIAQIRPHLRKIDAVQQIVDLAAGNICAGIVWSGDAFQAAYDAEQANTGHAIEYILPKEGTLLWFDTMAIPADAPNPENAHRFIDYMMRADVAAANAEFLWYASGNKAAEELLDKELLENPAVYPPPEVMKNLFVAPDYPPETDRLMTRLWSRFVAGR